MIVKLDGLGVAVLDVPEAPVGQFPGEGRFRLADYGRSRGRGQAGGAVDVSGALVVWHDGGFRVAGGAYPTDARAAWPDIDPDAYEDDLFDLIRAVA